MKSRSFRRKSSWIRYTLMILAICGASGLAYISVVTLNSALGVTKEVDVPDQLIRLQIVNGAGIKNLHKVIAARLEQLDDPELDITVVEKTELLLDPLPNTFVVSREEDLTAAQLLAKRLGLDANEVAFEPIVHNSKQITATLILGADYENGPVHEFATMEEQQEQLPQLTSHEIARKAADLALAKKGADIKLLDLTGLSSVCDYFVIVSGEAAMHVEAISENIDDGLRKMEVRPAHREGIGGGNWILLDYIDVVVHVFMERTRRFYALEKLWGDAPCEEIVDETADVSER